MDKKLFALLAVIATLCLLPAIQGPLQLDDTIHLEPILKWASTKSDTLELVFGNDSGPLGRPVSMLSFLLNAATTGVLIWPIKLTNLLLHLLTGFCLAKLFTSLFNRDTSIAAQAKVAGVAAAGLWLILPQHISTVFYVIQRMTILASLFSVLACWAFVVARERIEKKQEGGIPLLFGTAGLTLLAILSKESGLLVPLYCLLIELTYFRPDTATSRPRIIAWGFRLGVIYPCVLAAAYLAFNPDFVMGGYIDRPFSMTERAMTQISVLADYTASTFVPMVRSAGIYNDDFPVAEGLSLAQILLLLAGAVLISAAIGLRKKYPGFSLGIGLFFTGHLLESSIFSLEIYFAHRNYLPSMGLVLAVTGLITGFLSRYHDAATSFRRLLPLAFIGLSLVYGFASLSRALLWSDNRSLLVHAEIHHPASSRLRSELLLDALYSNRLDVALKQADIAMQSAPKNEKRAVQLWRILAYCYTQSPMPAGELTALYSMPADRVTLATSTALGYVSAAAEVNACPNLDRKQLGLLTGRWATTTVQPPHSPLVWKTRLATARLLASDGDLQTGLKHAEQAFYDSGLNFESGVLALQLANSLEDRDAADRIMSRLKANKANYSELQQSQLRALRNQ